MFGSERVDQEGLLSLKTSHPRPRETPQRQAVVSFPLAGGYQARCAERMCASLLRTASPMGEIKGERGAWPGLEKGRAGPRLAPRNPASSVRWAPSRTARHRLREPACACQAERSQLPPRDEKAPGKIKDTVKQRQLFGYRGPADQPLPCWANLGPRESGDVPSGGLWAVLGSSPSRAALENTAVLTVVGRIR